MNIAVIGTGYVGLVAGSCFAEGGNDVICVDNNADKVENLKQGVIPIYEPGLPELVERNTREERLSFTTDLADAVRKSLVIFLAVGTPTTPSGAADLSAVFAVAAAIGQAMDRYKVIVTKSTVPVGTANKIREIIRKNTKQAFSMNQMMPGTQLISQKSTGGSQPPRNRIVVSEHIRQMAAYSPSMNIIYGEEPYSTMKPATSSDSASGRSKGGRFVSASAEMKNTMNIGNSASQCQSRNDAGRPRRVPRPVCCAWTISVRFSEPTQSRTVTITKPMETS